MNLDYFSALKKIEHAEGVWLIHGDEPILTQNLLLTLRKSWQQQQIERERADLNSISEWTDALGLLDNQSLFSSRTALEIHTHHKPDAKNLDKIKRLIASPNDCILIICMPKIDYKSQNTAFYQAFVNTGATIVTLNINTPKERLNVLQLEAQKYGVQLTPDAWTAMLELTQNNLLAGIQALLKLSYESAQGQLIDPIALGQVLSEQSRFNLFDLSDAVLNGNVQKATLILRFLKETGEPTPLILWTLAKDMRILMEAKTQSYLSPQDWKNLGVWGDRQKNYQSALKRHQLTSTQAWSALLTRADACIKGIGDDDIWNLLLQISLKVAGVTLFESLA